ncbi:MAG: CoA pyrophosphatase [Sphingomonadaceae bacterium]|nr:CoA pyrophosphatase [Sphingomonadaceae bacterium]
MNLAGRLRAELAASEGAPVPFPGDSREIVTEPGVAAAVLIAVTDRPEPGLILTQRPETMRRHPGQVAFPGGRVDPEDGGAIAAALREAEEEIDLDPAQVEIIRMLAPYRTVTGFDVTPVLGVIPPDLPLTPHDREVAAVFELPLAYALDAANRVERRVMFEGRERRYFETMWGERRIWGATAAMLANLAARLA